MPQLTNRHKIVQVFKNESWDKFREYLLKNAIFINTCEDYHYSLTSPIVTTKLIKHNYNYKGFPCSFSVDNNNEIFKTSIQQYY